MKKAIALVVCLSVMTLAGCSDKDTQVENVPVEPDTSVSDSINTEAETQTPPEEVAPPVEETETPSEGEEQQTEVTEEQEDEYKVLEDGWKYYINRHDELVLVEYVGETEYITVKASYEVDGKRYPTVIEESTHISGPFFENKVIKKVTFEDGIAFPRDMSYMFKGCSNLIYVDTENLFTSTTSQAKEMFSGCSMLPAIDISMIKFGEKANISDMFTDCGNLKLILVNSNGNLRAIKSTSNLVSYCIVAEVMDNGKWDYEFNKELGVFNLTKYKGTGKAAPSPAYSLDGKLYTKVAYNGKEVADSGVTGNVLIEEPVDKKNTKPTTTKPATTKPATKPTTTKPSTTKPSTSTTKPSTSTTKPAEVKKQEYTVKFVTNCNQTIKDQKVLKGNKVEKPANPVNENYYQFMGWYTDSRFTTMYNFNSTVTGNITLYAKWQDATYGYVVEHYLQDPTNRSKYILKETEAVYTIKDDYVWAEAKEYSGYSENPSHRNAKYYEKITSNKYAEIALRIYYDKDEFTCKFVTNGGNNLEPQTVKNGEKFREVVPVKQGATFIGWYTDKECTDEYYFGRYATDITLYALWEEDYYNYVVEHYKEDTKGNYKKADSEKLEGRTGRTMTADYKDYEGYTVNTSHPDSKISAKLKDGSLVLKVYYQMDRYTVTYNHNNGTSTSEKVLPGGVVSKVPANPTRDGYEFTGWYTDSACTQTFNAKSKINADTTIYAGWKALPQPEPTPEPETGGTGTESGTPEQTN